MKKFKQVLRTLRLPETLFGGALTRGSITRLVVVGFVFLVMSIASSGERIPSGTTINFYR